MTSGLRLVLAAEQGGRCHYCGRAMTVDGPRMATVEHRVPRALGGGNERANVVAACLSCNQEKADMTEAQFIRRIRKRQKRAQKLHQRDSLSAQNSAARKAAERMSIWRLGR
jgi:5-methylcytosine-specific restriction endonuclease McrA